MKVNVTKENVLITSCSPVNEGEYMVNKCEFLLPDCFEGLTVTAAFNNIPIPLMGNVCYIPSLKKGTASLGVYAYRETDEGLELMYSPKPAYFYVDNGSYNDDIGEEDIPGITEFEKYCAQISALAIPKTDIVREFDITGEYTSDQIMSAAAVKSFGESVVSALENNRDVIVSLEKKYESFTADVDSKVADIENNVFGLGNALQGKKNDTGNVVIGDVSPVAHSLGIRLSSDTLSDFSGITVRRRGKNLYGLEGRVLKDFGISDSNAVRKFDGKSMYLSISGSNYYSPGVGSYTYQEDEDKVTFQCGSAWYGLGIDVPVKASEKYTVSAESMDSASKIVVSFYDANGNYISYSTVGINKFFRTPENAHWMLVILTTASAGSVVSYTKLQIEQGVEVTPFEKYVPCESASADSSGNVLGITSAYPTAILEADDASVNISVDYNRDINVAFSELRSAIVALGGVV